MLNTIIIRLLETTRKSYTKMAGACPIYGSGSYKVRYHESSATQAQKIGAKRNKEEQDLLACQHRDEYYRFWETSF